jgi:hypothetical protein
MSMSMRRSSPVAGPLNRRSLSATANSSALLLVETTVLTLTSAWALCLRCQHRLHDLAGSYRFERCHAVGQRMGGHQAREIEAAGERGEQPYILGPGAPR